MKRLLILLCLQLAVFTTQAMTDSLLMAQVAHTGVLLKQMQFDSALVQVDRLMPAAKQNHNMLAQATLHAVAGMALSRSHQLEKGLQEYMRCADIAEEHNLLVKALDEKTGVLLTLFSTVYGELSYRYQEQGNKVEALHYARIALRWISHARTPEIRVLVMASIMPVIAANKEWHTAYELMRQAFADAVQLKQYDFALVMATYLMTGEDECFGRGPHQRDCPPVVYLGEHRGEPPAENIREARCVQYGGAHCESNRRWLHQCKNSNIATIINPFNT